jgi:hypothetical protein
MAKTTYPVLTDTKDINVVVNWLKEVARLRELEDVPDFTNLKNKLLSGRTVDKIPSSATDVVATDVEGDWSTDGTYEYRLVDVAGTLKWSRILLDTAW